MSNDRSLNVSGQITNLGGSNIIEMGFTYSTGSTPLYEAIGDSNNLNWNVDVSNLQVNNLFFATLTGLTSTTEYYVRSYARNGYGLNQSLLPTIHAKTNGISILPTITCYIINMVTLLPQLNFEVGTTTGLIVSGETKMNDETIFTKLDLYQYSQPQPTNPIKTWNGQYLTYTTAGSVSVTFTPTSSNIDSQTMTQTAIYQVGNPNYSITATITANAYFPFLWDLKNSFGVMTTTYFLGSGGGSLGGSTTYFYQDASTVPSSTPSNGKLVENKGDKTFYMYNNSASKRYLAFGYPSSYGNSNYRINDGTWTPSTIIPMTVGTGYIGYSFGIINSWTAPYNIIELDLGVSPSMVTKFDIHFI